MLRQEMEKANKKIEETHKKTTELRKIREDNDRKYLKKFDKQKEEQEAAQRNKKNLELKLKQQ